MLVVVLVVLAATLLPTLLLLLLLPVLDFFTTPLMPAELAVVRPAISCIMRCMSLKPEEEDEAPAPRTPRPRLDCSLYSRPDASTLPLDVLLLAPPPCTPPRMKVVPAAA